MSKGTDELARMADDIDDAVCDLATTELESVVGAIKDIRADLLSLVGLLQEHDCDEHSSW